MKRFGAILTLVALIVTLSTSLCFAGSFELVESYPKDGSTGASVENLGVKVKFSDDLNYKEVAKENRGCFQLYDEEGKKLPTRVLYNPDEHGEVLVLLDTTAKNAPKPEGSTEYTLKISKDLVSDEGNTLDKAYSISFKTLNPNTSMMASMLMMVVMFGGMMLVSVRSAKKAAEEQTKQREEKVNPYKEAKKSGKSVEEIVEADQKKKAKDAERAAKKAAKEADDYYDEDEDINKYRVSKRRSAYKAGSKYAAARKAEAAKARAEKNAKKNASKGKPKAKKK